MQIKLEALPESVPVGEFADANGLVMVVRESKASGVNQYQWTASFENTRVILDPDAFGPVPHAAWGGDFVREIASGSLPDVAINNYASAISGNILVLEIPGQAARDIHVPRLSGEYAIEPDQAHLRRIFGKPVDKDAEG